MYSECFDLEAFFTCCFQICKEMVYNSPKKNITKRRKTSLQNAEKYLYKTPKNTIIELWSSLMNLFVETNTIRVKISNLLRLKK